MMACTKPKQWKKEKCERLRGEGDKVKYIDLAFRREQEVGFREGRRQDST